MTWIGKHNTVYKDVPCKALVEYVIMNDRVRLSPQVYRVQSSGATSETGLMSSLIIVWWFYLLIMRECRWEKLYLTWFWEINFSWAFRYVWNGYWYTLPKRASQCVYQIWTRKKTEHWFPCLVYIVWPSPFYSFVLHLQSIWPFL